MSEQQQMFSEAERKQGRNGRRRVIYFPPRKKNMIKKFLFPSFMTDRR